MNPKHILLAIVMTPFLGYVGYALTDWYLQKENPTSALQKLVPVESSCDLRQGCHFAAGDFAMEISQNSQSRMLKFVANQRLEGLMVEVVKVLPPHQAQKVDEAGYQWQVSLPPAAMPKPLTLHWVAKGHWNNYIGELTVD